MRPTAHPAERGRTPRKAGARQGSAPADPRAHRFYCGPKRSATASQRTASAGPADRQRRPAPQRPPDRRTTPPYEKALPMDQLEARDDAVRDVDPPIDFDAYWEALGDDAAHVGDVNTVPAREPGSEDVSRARSEPGARPDTGVVIEPSDTSPAVEGGAANTRRLLPIGELDVSLVGRGRAVISKDAVADYADRLEELPPIRVALVDDRPVVTAGLHRTQAHERAGRAEIACTVERMTWGEAVRAVVSDNRAHGVRM